MRRGPRGVRWAVVAAAVGLLVIAPGAAAAAPAGDVAGWWPLDQTGGATVADASGAGHVATALGAASWSGGAASFGGTAGQQVTTAGPVLDTRHDFSVSAWVNPASLPGWATFVVQQADIASGFYLEYDVRTNRWSFARSLTDTVASAVARAESDDSPVLGAWTQLVGVYDAAGGGMTLYVNGIAAGTAVDTAPIAATGPLVIGRGYHDGTPDNYMTGLIGNVQAYPRALAAADIANLYAAGRRSGPAAAPSVATPVDAHLGLILGITFVALLALGWLVFGRLGATRRQPDRLADLAPYRVAPPEQTARAPQDVARPPTIRILLGLSERMVRSVSRHQRIAAALNLAGIPLRPAEWLLIRAGASVVCAVLLGIIDGDTVLTWLAGLAIGWFGPRVYLSLRGSRRRTAFAEQLPDALQLVAGALQAGFSLPQALDAVVRDGAQPIAGEFARALARTRLGMSLEDAMDKAADRMRCADLAWVVMAVRIQRQVGGNLAELLLTTMHTMRERSQVRRQVKALTAEGRLSAYVLIGLPIGLANWMFLARRDYIRPLYTTPVGLVLLIVAVGCVTAGWFWMSRMIKVEV